jgi:hypothetical protein
MYSSSIFKTIYQTIQETFTEQHFEKYDAKMIYRPETIAAFQDDENKRAAAFREYASVRIRPSLVAGILGIDMPTGHDITELDEDYDKPETANPVNPLNNPELPAGQQATPDSQQPKPTNNEPMPPMDNMPAKGIVLTLPMLKDLNDWGERALAWHKRGKSAEDWECKALPAEIADEIRVKLRVAKNELDIQRAFQVTNQSEIMMLAEALNNAVAK